MPDFKDAFFGIVEERKEVLDYLGYELLERMHMIRLKSYIVSHSGIYASRISYYSNSISL